jgi:hypothetical protein
MSPTPIALTGPAAAALLKLDGFRDLDWPLQWCMPRSGSHRHAVLRTRSWKEPTWIGETPVAPAGLVLRHLGNDSDLLKVDHLTPLERVELAVEHALRLGLITVEDLRIRGSYEAGDVLLRTIAKQRGDEPPTESYAETRSDQVFRSLGYWCWRQLPIVGANHRVDFVLPANGRPDKRRPRPVIFRPELGLIIEIDSKEFHANAFEQDHLRQANYDRLGYRWVSFTPNQIERSPQLVNRTIEGALRTMGARRRRAA